MNNPHESSFTPSSAKITKEFSDKKRRESSPLIGYQSSKYDPAKDKSLQLCSTPEVRKPYSYPPKNYPKTIEDAIAEGTKKINTKYDYRETRKAFLQRYKLEIDTSDEELYFTLKVFVRGYESPCYHYMYSFDAEENVLFGEAQYRYRPNQPLYKDLHDQQAAEGDFDSDAQPFIIDKDGEKKFIVGTEPLRAFEIRHNIMFDLKEEYPHLKDAAPTSIRGMDVTERKTIHILEKLIGFDSTNENEIASFDKNSDGYKALMAGYVAPTHARWLQQDHPDKEITQIIVKGTDSALPEIEYIIGDRT